MSDADYIVAGRQPWNRTHFNEKLSPLAGHWHFAATRDELNNLLKEHPHPRYLFFVHWSEKVPAKILEGVECVGFHMTDVPFGRGGSPLQNLLSRGIKDTKLTALRMSETFDAGPVYMKQDFSLAEGSAHELYQRASLLSCDMIKSIAANEPTPEPQKGEPTVFKRRTPEQSELTENIRSLDGLHDHIRMLDAPGYPHAYIDVGDFRIEFTSSQRDGDQLKATAEIKKKEIQK